MKKNIIITTLFFFMVKESFCQNDSSIVKGRKFISGYYGVYNFNNKPTDPKVNSLDKNLDIYFRISYGKFIKNNKSQIFSIGYGKSYENLIGNNKEKTSTFIINGGYNIEKYKLLTNNFGILGGIEANVDYYSSNNEITYAPGSTSFVSPTNMVAKTSINSRISIYPGLIFFFNSKWALTGQIGYLGLSNFYSEKIKQNQAYLSDGLLGTNNIVEYNSSFSFSPSFSINNSGIGLRYFLK